MSWIIEHFQIIIVAAGVVAYWIKKRGPEKAGHDEDYDGDRVPEARHEAARREVRELVPASRDGSSPDSDERVRRIQEEIRRKIAERRGQASPPSPPASSRAPFSSVLQETARTAPPPVAMTVPASARPQIDPYDEAATLAHQRSLADQLEKIEAKRLEAVRVLQVQSERDSAGRGAHAAYAISVSKSNATGTGFGERSLAAELREPRALRRAVVLREILGPPVALR